MTTQSKETLPADVYIPFVETLFRDGRTLAVGIAAQAMLAVAVFAKTGAPAYFGITLAFIAIGVLRLFAIRRVLMSPPLTTRAEASRRENVYIFWGSLHAFLLGVFCFTAIYLSPDMFAESAAICVTLASATSIVGRNYGSPRLVMAQIIALVSPFSLAYLLRGDVYHVILGLCSIPFLYAIRNFAKVVRDVLYAALSEERRAASLAQRFNRALNTMSHGLVMLGPEGRVVVANAEAARLMQLASPEKLLGRSIHALLARGVAGERLAARDCRFIEAQLTRALKEGRSRKVLVSLTNGQHYEFSAREGSQELGVITFEEVTSRIAAEEKIRNMARFDSLTGLANRAYFNELVSDLMTSGDPDRLCAFVMLDLDDFKNINDTLGHPIGDGLIVALSERLAIFSSERVTISRFGGDEFMLFVDNLSDEFDLTSLLNDIFANLQGEVDVMGHALRIEVSGGAIIARVGETDADAMIMRADLALYKAKEEGKNRWKLFAPVMDAAFRDRQVLKADLRSAVEARQLRVVYQPIIALSSMRIASCEALCRWDHPELGPISPAMFIPLAEEMGIISQISAFVLDSAASECARWPSPISVSVNLSAKDFRHFDIVEKVQSALQRHKLAPQRLEIEITETALLDDKALTRTAIEGIKRLGVQIALDDFGTGYSSLSYLHNLPFDKVKIDRSFLKDISANPRTLELVKGVVSLSRLLGLQITIEGVETFEQLKALSQEVKPDLVQGFLFGAALSASGITTMSTAVWPFAEHLGSLRSPALN